MRPLTVASPTCIPALPNVPTIDEFGVRGMIMSVWFGIARPGALPKDIVTRLNAAINTSLAKGQLPERLKKLGSTAQPGAAEMFNDFWKSELARSADIVRVSGAVME